MEVKENQELGTKGQEKKKRNSSRNFKLIIFIVIIIIIVISIISIEQSREKRITIRTKSTLQKIIEISDLSTVEYTYNAIVTKYKDNKRDNSREDKNAEYYVSYEGKVTAGIDFNEISVDIKDDTIKITLPDTEIHETRIDMGTLDYIHIGNTKESDSISQEAYKLCKQDLKERVENEEEILQNAKENAKSVIKALLQPWIDSLNGEYKVEIN